MLWVWRAACILASEATAIYISVSFSQPQQENWWPVLQDSCVPPWLPSPTLLVHICCFHWKRMQDIQAIPSSILDVWTSWECFTPQLLLAANFHTLDWFFWQLPLFCSLGTHKSKQPLLQTRGASPSLMLLPTGRPSWWHPAVWEKQTNQKQSKKETNQKRGGGEEKEIEKNFEKNKIRLSCNLQERFSSHSKE